MVIKIPCTRIRTSVNPVWNVPGGPSKFKISLKWLMFRTKMEEAKAEAKKGEEEGQEERDSRRRRTQECL